LQHTSLDQTPHGQNEAGTLARVRTLRRALLDPKIAEHKGRIAKTIGDGILSGFLQVREGTLQGAPSRRSAPLLY